MSAQYTRSSRRVMRRSLAAQEADETSEEAWDDAAASKRKKRKTVSKRQSLPAPSLVIQKPRYVNELLLKDEQDRCATPESRCSSPGSAARRSSRITKRKMASVSAKQRQSKSSRASRTPVSARTPVSSRASSVASTSAKGAKKSKTANYNGRGYNPSFVKESDYHYGSDFEDDPDLEDEDKYDLKNGHGDDSNDSDDSSLANGDEDDDLKVESDVDLDCLATLDEDEDVPFWLREDDNKSIPLLVLPQSSEDLLVDSKYILSVISVYEVLRRCSQLLRLTPFRVEDFCAALAAEEQSNLLSEIHMSLLKALVRAEESQGVAFSPVELKDSTNCVFFFMDVMSWPESLRAFLQSDADNCGDLVEVMQAHPEYPFVDSGVDEIVKVRMQVLAFLTDQFLQTGPVRDFILGDGNLNLNEEHCRICHRLGEMLVCDSCSGVYHIGCLDPPLTSIPDEEWQCYICQYNFVEGVSDCNNLFSVSNAINNCRLETLGTDRLGNRYWFVCRRLVVEGREGNVAYYSTVKQLEELSEVLDDEVYEKELWETMEKVRVEMERQMNITESLTEQRKMSKKSYLELENAAIEKVQKKREEQERREMEALETNEDNDKVKEEEGYVAKEDGSPLKNANCTEDHDTQASTDSEIKMESSESKLPQESVENVKTDDTDGEAGPSKKSELDASDIRMTRRTAQEISSGTLYFKLGQENTYQKYVNYYSVHASALSKGQAVEERSRRQHFSHKFSLTDLSALKWNGNLHSQRPVLMSTLKQTILQLETSIPTLFMHPNWPLLRKPWATAVNSGKTIRDLARALVVLQCCVRPAVLLPVWSESLGHIKLKKTTPLLKDDRKRVERRERKEKEEEEERLRPFSNFVKYTLGLKHQVAKQKGEEYRVHGQHGWLWMRSTRVFKPSDASKLGLRAGPARVAIKYTDVRDNKSRVVLMEPKAFAYFAAKQKEMMEQRVKKEESDSNEEKDGINLREPKGSPHKTSVKEKEDNEPESEVVDSSQKNEGNDHKETLNLEESVKLKSEESLENSASSEDKPDDQSTSGSLKRANIADALKNARLEEQAVPLENTRPVVNISESLSHQTRSMYPKVAGKASILDDLLSRRLHLKALEERRIALKIKDSATNSAEMEVKQEKEANEVYTSQSGTTNKPLSNNSARQFLLEAKANILKHIQSVNSKSGQTVRSCYSLSTHGNKCFSCYCQGCLRKQEDIRLSVANAALMEEQLLKNAQEMKIVGLNDLQSERKDEKVLKNIEKSKARLENLLKVVEAEIDKSDFQGRKGIEEEDKKKEDDVLLKQLGITRHFSSCDTRGKIYLQQIESTSESRRQSKVVKYPLPPSFFSSFSKRHNILQLAKHDVKHMARTAGVLSCAEGFNYNSKVNLSVWPYPCPRPSFKTAWLYRSATMTSIQAAALQLRILWASLRWDDMMMKPLSTEGKHQETTDEAIITTEILKQRHIGRFMELTQYLQRKVTIPLDVRRSIIGASAHSNRSRLGLRKIKRTESSQKSDPKFVEQWVNESAIELWEVRAYKERLERERNSSLTRMKTGTAIKEPQRLDPSRGESTNRKEKSVLKEDRQGSKQNNGKSSGTKKVMNNACNGSVATTSAPTTIIRGVLASDGKYSIVGTTPTTNSTTQSKYLTPDPESGSQRLINISSLPPSATKKIFVCKDGKIVGTQVVPRNPTALVPPSTVLAPKTPTAVSIVTPNSKGVGSDSSKSPSLIPQQQQKLQLIRSADGKIQVKGLLPGQQVIQTADGKFQIQSVAVPTKQTDAQDSLPKAQILSPGIPALPANQPPTQSHDGKTSANATDAQDIKQENETSTSLAPSTPVVKPAVSSPSLSTPRQLVQLRSLGQNTVKIQGNQIIVSGPDVAEAKNIAQQISSGQVKLANFNGKQVLVSTKPSPLPRPQSSDPMRAEVSSSMSPTPISSNSSLPPQSPVTPTALLQSLQPTPPPPTTPQAIQVVNQESHISPQKEEKATVSSVPTEVTAQLIQTSQGPRIILQGIQGSLLPRDDLKLIQQQVKDELLKAQEEASREKLPPPTKIVFKLPENIREKMARNSNAAKRVAQANIASQVVGNNNPTLPTTTTTVPTPNAASAPPTAPEAADGSFKLTQAMIQEAISNALKTDKLTPQTEHKLKQAMQYHQSTNTDTSNTTETTSKPKPAEARLSQRSLATLERNRTNLVNKVSSALLQRKEELKREICSKREKQEKMVRESVQRHLEQKREEEAQQKMYEQQRTSNDSSLGNHIMEEGPVEEKRGRKRKPNSRYSNEDNADESSDLQSRNGEEAHRAKKRRRDHDKDKNEELYCICKTKYDRSKFYVGCDSCKNWFHGKCVGVTVKMSRKMSGYICDQCQASQKDMETLYCLCRQPYDESQCYIACEKCSDWFHCRCVGILQCEAEAIDVYFCPKCEPHSDLNKANFKKLNDDGKEVLKRLNRKIMGNANSSPLKHSTNFRPILPNQSYEAPAIDMTLVDAKVNGGKYEHLWCYLGEMIAIFDTCRFFNAHNPALIGSVEHLEQFLAEKLKSVRDKLAMNPPVSVYHKSEPSEEQ